MDEKIADMNRKKMDMQKFAPSPTNEKCLSSGKPDKFKNLVKSPEFKNESSDQIFH